MNYADDFIINKTGDKRSHSIVHQDDVPTDILPKTMALFLTPLDWNYICTSCENAGAGHQCGRPPGAWGSGHGASDVWRGASTAQCLHCPGRT